MKIYTKTGDNGTTSLANGQRVSKTDPRLEAYGTADELNSFVGLLRAKVDDNEFDSVLHFIQNKLFNLGAQLAGCNDLPLTTEDITRIEQNIDALSEDLPVYHGFILPAGSEKVALCHVCRTITRRLERCILALENSSVDPNSAIFVNRLSDFFFILAKKLMQKDENRVFLWEK